MSAEGAGPAGGAVEAVVREAVDAWFASTSEVYATLAGPEQWRRGVTRYVSNALVRAGVVPRVDES